MNARSRPTGEERPLDMKAVLTTIKNGMAHFQMIEPLVSQRYVLALLFLKYVSDQVEAGNLILLPPHSKFHVLYDQREAPHIGPLLNIAINEFVRANKGLDGLFKDMDFEASAGISVDRWRHALQKSLECFNSLDLKTPWPNLINEVYGQLAAKAEKGTSAFFTPPDVANLITELLEPKSGETICDPACGTGNLLLPCASFLQKKGVRDVRLFGQEIFENHWMVAKMNLFLNQCPGRLEREDTLWYPQLVDEKGDLLKFHLIVSNPPFSLNKWGAENAEKDLYNRFHRGVPHAGGTDMAFLSHIVETMDPETGRVGAILPYSSLTRKGSEKNIRQALIDENLVDAVIGLPNKIFINSLFVAIVILKKQRPDTSILFMDATEEFKPGKRNVLTEAGASRIVSAYQSRRSEGQFSRLVPRNEIGDDAGLNPHFFLDN